MKIKRIVIPFITLVIMTSQLAGCATLSSQEMLESAQESPDISIEWATPDPGQQSLDASGAITVGDQQFVTNATQEDDEDSDVTGVIDQQQEVKELSGTELENYFQLAYDSGAILEGDLETRILGELDILVSLVDGDATAKLPADYSSQYRDWRPAEAVQLFTDVNETVYATGTVNIRSGPGTTYDKVGSLNKGDSVTRTGIGINDADGWSRIQLSNGNVVYVASSYLSMTKPVVQQQQPSQSNPTGGQQQTQTPTDGSQQSSGGSQVSDEEIQAQIEAALKQQQEAINNGATFGSGNLTNEIIEDIGTKLNGG